ncbi:hypothetical protein ACGFU4_21785 [Streptomyces sp. NPDC048511]|uniref:hypothetical protein n=1 Tax=Streptomyces sp. NPDC048511 TaxID=3365562 RepID=UPI0037107CDB
MADDFSASSAASLRLADLDQQGVRVRADLAPASLSERVDPLLPPTIPNAVIEIPGGFAFRTRRHSHSETIN